MHKIAIIKTCDFYTYDGYDDYNSKKIIDSITDWDDVTEEEYKCLMTMSTKLGYSILERPVNGKEFICKTVKDYQAYIKAEEERIAEEKRQRDEAALARKMKKDLKDRASKEKMLAKLIDELGPEAVKSLTLNN